jgi:uncharacterized protein (TIGR00369 family)
MVDEQKIRESFGRQGLMSTLGAKLVTVSEGSVTIECARHAGLTQQHGFFHAGVLTSLADSACGYAAFTLMPPGNDVLTVEFKINLLKPADTNKVIAVGTVIQAGKTLTVCEGHVYDESGSKLLARMTATMIARTPG